MISLSSLAWEFLRIFANELPKLARTPICDPASLGAPEFLNHQTQVNLMADPDGSLSIEQFSPRYLLPGARQLASKIQFYASIEPAVMFTMGRLSETADYRESIEPEEVVVVESEDKTLTVRAIKGKCLLPGDRLGEGVYVFDVLYGFRDALEV